MKREHDETIDTPLQALRQQWFEDLKAHLHTYYHEVEESQQEKELENIIKYFPIKPKHIEEVYALIKGNNTEDDNQIDTILDMCYIELPIETNYPRE